MKKNVIHAVAVVALIGSVAMWPTLTPAKSNDSSRIPFHAQGEKAGDPTQDSVILLTRLTAVEEGEIECDVPGMDGRARFEISKTPDFKDSRMTPWANATNEKDHTIKQTVTGLKPGSDYCYRVHITDASAGGERVGPARAFKTAPSADQPRNVRFAAITGQGYQTRDDDRGHHAYLAMEKLGIDFIALTGDTVYYDGPAGGVPKSLWPPGVESSREVHRAVVKLLREMTDDEAVLWLRKHWHAIYALPIQREFFGQFAGYWEVDDHDYRTDNCSEYYKPGSIVFREQNPVPERTYRTVRWGKGLQIWLLEGRELRNRNAEPPTIWGREQFGWLVESLAESDAAFKVLISPSPIVGSGMHPTDGPYSDNHTHEPFLAERAAFFNKITERGVTDLYVICGDRHSKYHTRSKEYGVHEFCVGALSAKHGARGNFAPAEDKSGLVDLLHDFDPNRTGGFLCVEVEFADQHRKPTLAFTHYDADGNKLAGWLFSVCKDGKP